MNLQYIIDLFSYPFFIRSLIVGVFISVCASLLGIVLVLKKFSLIGHALGDVSFASLSIALALGLNPLTVSVPVTITASFVIMYLAQKTDHDKGDSIIGAVATTSLALGIIITAATNGFNIDVTSYMFGSILALTDFDVVLCIVFSLLVIVVFLIFYNRIFLITVDENFAKASGINTNFYKFLISSLVAVTIVIGMKMVGTLLISSLIIFPCLCAGRLPFGFKGMTVAAVIFAVICFVLGVFISVIFNVPAGASIVAANVTALAAVSVYRSIKA